LELRNGRISKWKAEAIPHQKNSPSRPAITNVDQPIITANRLDFSYGDQIVIRNLTFAAYRGDIIAIMGNNGSGKTTLLTLLGGLQKPKDGEIQIESTPVSSLSSQELAKRVAMVFQNPNYQIFERTVWKEQILNLEVLEMLNDDSLEKAAQNLKSAHLDDLKERNPFSLSHGQKRRLNVTSIVNHEPRIYLFDEPLIGQDIPGRQLMAEIIRKRATHDSGFALQNCNRVLFMDNGSILLDGSPAAVIQRLEEMGKPEYSGEELGI
jgi:energy-coupling factor transport system ATP-binding protein